MRWFLVATLLASACSKKSAEGLPPAQEWSQNGQGAMVQTGPNAIPPPAPPPGMSNPRGGGGGMAGGSDPHAGLGIDPADPHAGLGIDPSDPHAGLDMNGSGGGGTDVTKLGLPPPDPNRNIDPTRYVKGVIHVHMKAKDRAKAGIPIFIIVKRADAAGQPTGTPLAVDKLVWNNSDLPFELTEQNAMVAGTALTGDVIVTARYDQDSDALSKEPGDIVGQAKVTLPADNVQIWLDTIL
ncbi:MAG: hypothetical protein IPQ07_03515 [Myxococcales bacterium]|nr:hypothetical protein [Myxococcales bacterium]